MKKLEIAALVLLGLLFFVWPMPRTISLRDLLLVLILLVSGYLAWRQGWPRGNPRTLFAPAIMIATLTAWMYFVAFFISPESAWSIDELNSQWIRALVALVAGVVVAMAVGSDSNLKQKVLLVIFAALLLHVLTVDILAVKQWSQDLMEHRELGRISGLAGGPDKSNYLTNLLLCFLLAESLYRLLSKKRALPFGNVLLGSAVGVALFSMFAERMRNGVAVFVLMLLIAGLLWLLAQKSRLRKTGLVAGAAALAVITLGGLGLAVAIKGGSDLKKLIETAPVAWDTEHHQGWLDEKKYGLPALPSGETVDPSAYMRIAWLKQGLLIIGEHPLGIGFGRNAYGHGLKAKYGEGRGHSHSGLLDLAIGTGVPGTLLWLGFFVSLMRLAWKHTRATHNHAAILLMLLLLDFGARMFLDSVIRDHMLQQFMLLVGFASVIMMRGTQGKERSSA
jgi:hypothetical protein